MTDEKSDENRNKVDEHEGELIAQRLIDELKEQGYLKDDRNRTKKG